MFVSVLVIHRLLALVHCCFSVWWLVVIVVYCLQLKKDDILSNSIQTRSKAHSIIKRMLASLGDPYTRFLSPEEVIHSSIFTVVALWRFFILSIYACGVLANEARDP
jgi:hypothetical protein